MPIPASHSGRSSARIILLLILCSLFSPWKLQPALAAAQQPEIGILLEEPAVSASLLGMLEGQSTISFAALPADTPAQYIEQLRRRQLDLMAVLPDSYLIADEVRSKSLQNEIVQARVQQLRQFRSRLTQRNDGATGVFPGILMARHPNLKQPPVLEYIRLLTTRLNQDFPAQDVYLVSNQRRHIPEMPTLQQVSDAGNAASLRNSRAPLFASQSLRALARPGTSMHLVPRFEHDELRQLQEFLRAVKTAEAPARVLFREADFIAYSQQVPGFRNLLREYSQPGIAVVALPAPEVPAPRLHFSAILLLLLWLSFGLHYFLSSSYRRSIRRYFLSHTFFIEDVLDRHVRFAISALLVLIQTGLMWGIMFYTVVPALMSGAGMEGLSWHYPIIDHNWTLLVISFIAGTAFNLCCILWLGIACARPDGIAQAATLQMWPTHAGLVLTTLTVPAVAAGVSPIFAAGLLAGFVLINLFAFLIAALHFSRRPTLALPLHWLSTVVLYIGLISASGLLLFYGSRLGEVFYMAISI